MVGVHHRVAIECKDTSRPVERDDAIAFAGKIHDLPSTIGIFIARSGFQPSAKKYLQDHGILNYGGGDLPRFGSALAAMISVALPGESAVGQPFWTLMVREEGQTTGTWQLIPALEDGNRRKLGVIGRKKGADGVFPLFYSRLHAELFHQLAFDSSPEICVRGIEQPALRFILLCANDENRRFAILQPLKEGEVHRFTYEEWTAQDLAREYSVHDLSSHFKALSPTRIGEANALSSRNLGRNQ